MLATASPRHAQRLAYLQSLQQGSYRRMFPLIRGPNPGLFAHHPLPSGHRLQPRTLSQTRAAKQDYHWNLALPPAEPALRKFASGAASLRGHLRLHLPFPPTLYVPPQPNLPASLHPPLPLYGELQPVRNAPAPGVRMFGNKPRARGYRGRHFSQPRHEVPWPCYRQ